MYQKTIELNPNHPYVYINLASLYQGQYNFKEAIQILLKLIEENPSANYYNELGRAYFGMCDYINAKYV